MIFPKIHEDNRELSELSNYIQFHYPEIADMVEGMRLYEAVCLICDYFHIEPPLEGEYIRDTAPRILAAITEVTRRTVP